MKQFFLFILALLSVGSANVLAMDPGAKDLFFEDAREQEPNSNFEDDSSNLEADLSNNQGDLFAFEDDPIAFPNWEPLSDHAPEVQSPNLVLTSPPSSLSTNTLPAPVGPTPEGSRGQKRPRDVSPSPEEEAHSGEEVGATPQINNQIGIIPTPMYLYAALPPPPPPPPPMHSIQVLPPPMIYPTRVIYPARVTPLHYPPPHPVQYLSHSSTQYLPHNPVQYLPYHLPQIPNAPSVPRIVIQNPINEVSSGVIHFCTLTLQIRSPGPKNYVRCLQLMNSDSPSRVVFVLCDLRKLVGLYKTSHSKNMPYSSETRFVRMDANHYGKIRLQLGAHVWVISNLGAQRFFDHHRDKLPSQSIAEFLYTTLAQLQTASADWAHTLQEQYEKTPFSPPQE